MKKKIILQSWYEKQTLFIKIFSFIIEKISSVQWFLFRKQGFVIFSQGLRNRISLRLVGETTWH